MQMEVMKNLIASSDIEKELLKNLNTIFADSDYEILRIRINNNKKKNIQIMIDHKRKNIDINDCANYSRKISNYLENNNLILDEFDLEISSPGLDRPLTRLKDFLKYRGDMVSITEINADNKKIKHKGKLAQVTQNNIFIDQNNDLVSIKFSKICSAKLLI